MIDSYRLDASEAQLGSPKCTDSVQSESTREEMKWTDKHEDLLHLWREEANDRSKYHGQKGRRFQIVFAVLGIPSVIIPMCTGILSEIKTGDNHLVLIMSVILSCVNGILTFLNPGKKSGTHYRYEAEFASFVVMLDVVLSKPRRYRSPADMTLERVSAQYNKIVSGAPP